MRHLDFGCLVNEVHWPHNKWLTDYGRGSQCKAGAGERKPLAHHYSLEALPLRDAFHSQAMPPRPMKKSTTEMASACDICMPRMS